MKLNLLIDNNYNINNEVKAKINMLMICNYWLCSDKDETFT